jgi:hypothetical protein
MTARAFEFDESQLTIRQRDEHMVVPELTLLSLVGNDTVTTLIARTVMA